MTRGPRDRFFALVLLLAGVSILAWAGPEAAIQAVPDQGVPKDLRPLLVPRQSEMRLVTVRYTADRAALNSNYTAGLGVAGGSGRGGGASADPPVLLSTARIARLKRYDLDWQAALAGIDPTTLSSAGRAELETLRKTVGANMAALDAEAAAIADVLQLVPFAPSILALSEARARIEDVDAQKAAGIVTAVTAQVTRIHAQVEAGLGGAGGAEALRVGKGQALTGARAVDALRGALTEWFTFFNGYDPLFTWWMGLPFKHADTALAGYAALLRDKVAPAALASPNVVQLTARAIAPAPAFASVPDLRELMALPQDEMTAIVARFRGVDSRGGRAGAGGAAPARDRAFYQAWLAALRTLDFASLGRNAQVDYLFIRKTAEQQLARLDITLPADPPRRADNSGILGAARGGQGLIFDLQDQFIPYTPEELIAIGDKEFAWCEEEMRKASRQMGFGDNWKQALERVKDIHPPPGGQPAVVRDLMFGAVDFLRARDLVTVPAVATESLRMIMMTPERQLMDPFFTGGSRISVAYPTDTLEYEARIQSMRGNNIPSSHAVAFHEMIPGHNLQYYMRGRYGDYRADLGGTPFWTEGWCFYWEMLMYDIGFHATPEEKVGALFWRMHRSARITFSLRFHMGEWSPQECIDFLVDRVGHERVNATGEVRRAFQETAGVGRSWPPLQQASYLLGGVQIRALHRELVDGGKMTEKAFHDEIMRQGSMPIAFLRLALSRDTLTRDTPVDWKFYGDL